MHHSYHQNKNQNLKQARAVQRWPSPGGEGRDEVIHAVGRKTQPWRTFLFSIPTVARKGKLFFILTYALIFYKFLANQLKNLCHYTF
jgi:hypothetical protein